MQSEAIVRSVILKQYRLAKNIDLSSDHSPKGVKIRQQYYMLLFYCSGLEYKEFVKHHKDLGHRYFDTMFKNYFENHNLMMRPFNPAEYHMPNIQKARYQKVFSGMMYELTIRIGANEY